MKFKVTHHHHRYDDDGEYIVKVKDNKYSLYTHESRYRENDESLFPQYSGIKVVDTGDSMVIFLGDNELTLDYVQWAALSSIFEVEKREEFEDYSVRVVREK